jgi:hypothetical protein
MDPVTLAVAALRLLQPIWQRARQALEDRAADKLGEGAVDLADRLYGVLEAKLSGDSYDLAMLEGARNKPDDQFRQRILTDKLAQLFAEDSSFAEAVAKLAKPEPSLKNIQVNAVDSGITSAGPVTQTASNGNATGRDNIQR